MAPFIPQGLINPDLNLFFALIIGFGFGYLLEQAGFSSSKKLAGVFYGYDFVVLRVFFTAGITAMTGLLFLSYLGWVDMDLVYVNPTYLWSAIVGGVIMGFGFILGGFCPGTSIVAAVIGKIDAMVFIIGIFIGIFIFGHFYDSFEPLYNGSFLGHPFIYDSLGISEKWFAFFMVVVALGAFIVTKVLEDKINKVDIIKFNDRINYTFPAFLLLLLVIIHLMLPQERKSSLYERSNDEIISMYNSEEYSTTAIEAAYKIMHSDPDFLLIDVRDSLSREKFRLPGAIELDVENMFERNWEQFFKENKQKKVFYSFGEADAALAWHMAARAGYDNIHILKGGLNGFFQTIFINNNKPENGNLIDGFNYRFVEKAKKFFMEGGAVKQEEDKPKPVKKIIEITTPVAGGC